MNKFKDSDITFWKIVEQRLSPLHEAHSGRVIDENYTGLSLHMTREEIEKESISMDEELAILEEMFKKGI